MQIQFLWGPKTKYLPQVAVIGNRGHALRAIPITIVTFANYVSNTNRGRWQPVWPSCEPKLLRAQNAHRRCDPTNDPSQDLRHLDTCRGNRPTRYRRRPKGVVPNGARPPKLFGRPTNLTACSYGPSKVSKKLQYQQSPKDSKLLTWCHCHPRRANTTQYIPNQGIRKSHTWQT